SAGGAIALRLAELRPVPHVIGLNAAVSGFSGVAGVLFPLMAKALSALPFVATMFTASATRPGSVERLIAGTGSDLPSDDLRFYRRLVSDRDHVAGTLAMMAQWSLDPLLARLPEMQTPVTLITGDRDHTVPPRVSADLAARMPHATHVSLPGLGHLAHEEDAPRVETAIRAALAP
ncbi:alpha/beta fold hydrolase BchO, partial [Jannaschia pohangensis]